MPLISYSFDTYKYFLEINEGKIEGNVLDYGCNYSPFLLKSKGQIQQEYYTGIDVDISSLNLAKKLFPKSNFIHSNRYNIVYNKTGKDIFPTVDKGFSYIISYSVLTHTTIDDMIETIKWLYEHLETNGKMFISWLNISNLKTVNYFYKKRILDFGYCDKIESSDYVYLIDNKINKIEKEGDFFLLFLTKEYLQKLLKPYQSIFISSNDFLQDCFIIQKK